MLLFETCGTYGRRHRQPRSFGEPLRWQGCLLRAVAEAHEPSRPLRVGLPKGRLSSLSHRFILWLETRQPLFPEIGLWQFRIQDIPRLVSSGELDAGVASDEWITESGAEVRRLTVLNWCNARICLAAPLDFTPGPGLRIVSEYPSLATSYARGQWGESSSVRTVFGSAEAYVPVFADAVIDCVETGETLRRSNLVVHDVLLESACWLIASPSLEPDGMRLKTLRQLSPGLRSVGERYGRPRGDAPILQSLPPHIGILAWPSIQYSGKYDPLSISLPQELRTFGVAAVIMSPYVQFCLHPGSERSYDFLEDELRSRDAVEAIRPLYEVISVMSIFDEEFRAKNIYSGHISRASDRAAESLLDVCGITFNGNLADALDALQAFELIYRFPVARKFTGGYVTKRQCRPNGWGRLLYSILERSELNSDIENWRGRIADHLQKHLRCYQDGVGAALASDDRDGSFPWREIAEQLPIPVVI